MPALGDHVFFKKLLFISTGPLHEKSLDTRMVKLRLFEAIACET